MTVLLHDASLIVHVAGASLCGSRHVYHLEFKKYLSTCMYKYAYKFKKMIAPRRVEKRLEAVWVGGGT